MLQSARTEKKTLFIMKECKDASNWSTILYDIYKIYQDISSTSKNALIKELLKHFAEKTHPEAWMALAMIAYKENNVSEKQKYLDRITKTATFDNDSKRPAFFHHVPSNYKKDICKALSNNIHRLPTDDPRFIKLFLVKFIGEINETWGRTTEHTANFDDKTTDNIDL